MTHLLSLFLCTLSGISFADSPKPNVVYITQRQVVAESDRSISSERDYLSLWVALTGKPTSLHTDDIFSFFRVLFVKSLWLRVGKLDTSQRYPAVIKVSVLSIRKFGYIHGECSAAKEIQ